MEATKSDGSTKKARPAGAGAVMASRLDPLDSLDFFPTPPWATRALCEIVLPAFGANLANARVWEPACGEGHMSATLAEYAAEVFASDVYDYGRGQDAVGSFVGLGPDVIQAPRGANWIITNPPFNLAEQFLYHARREASGVALLVRTNWLESKERFDTIFAPDRHAPDVVAIFCERVPIVKGRWNPKASTATSYCWCIWLPFSAVARGSRLFWIPPGQRQRLTTREDYARFLAPKESPTAAPETPASTIALDASPSEARAVSAAVGGAS